MLEEKEEKATLKDCYIRTETQIQAGKSLQQPWKAPLRMTQRDNILRIIEIT